MDRKLFEDVIKICEKLVEDCDFYTDGEILIWDAFNKLNIKDKYKELVDLKESNQYEKRRWSIPVEDIVKIGEWYLLFTYDIPATEMQEGQPTNMEIIEVYPKEITTITYLIAKDDK